MLFKPGKGIESVPAEEPSVPHRQKTELVPLAPIYFLPLRSANLEPPVNLTSCFVPLVEPSLTHSPEVLPVELYTPNRMLLPGSTANSPKEVEALPGLMSF